VVGVGPLSREGSGISGFAETMCVTARGSWTHCSDVGDHSLQVMDCLEVQQLLEELFLGFLDCLELQLLLEEIWFLGSAPKRGLL